MSADPPGPRAARSPVRFAPPLLWMAVIAVGSSSLLTGDRTGRFIVALLAWLAPWASLGTLVAAHVGLRKLGHLVEFGILAVLWRRAFAPWPRAVSGAFVLTSLYAGVDELRQGLTPDRSPAVADVAIDMLGALLGLAVWEGPGPLGARATRAVAWVLGCAAGLGLLLLPLDLAIGRPAWGLGACAIGLAAVAAGLGRVSRRMLLPATWRRCQ